MRDGFEDLYFRRKLILRKQKGASIIERPLMVLVPFVVVLVSFQILLSLVATLLLLCEAFVILDLRFVNVARVIATGPWTVSAPGAKADPAKMMLALLALHVVAALILLDLRRAVRAFLRIRK